MTNFLKRQNIYNALQFFLKKNHKTSTPFSLVEANMHILNIYIG